MCGEEEMSPEHTRRDFMKLTATGVAGLAVANSATAMGIGTPQPPSGEIAVRLTHGTKRFVLAAPLKWQRTAPVSEAIILDPARTYQRILGFGGAFTDAACYMFNQLTPANREKLFHELFHSSEMNLSVGRVCIGSSDYATRAYSYCDGDPDPELTRFSIAPDKEYILPLLRESRKVNPELFLLGSPWSPPGWMKSSGTMLGGSFKKKHYSTYAQYFLKFLNAYAAEGVPVNAITTQNEVDTDQDGRMPACLWGQEYEIEFISRHLGPVLTGAGVNTKIWVLDHNYDLWGRALSELEKPTLNKYVDGIAWHGYAGDPTAMTRVHDAYPDKHAYWTEGGPDITDPAYARDWAKWSSTFAGILRNWSRCIMAWNLALDESGKPNIGPFPCGGVMTIHSATKEITYSGQYWALAHYSRSIRRDALRFDSQGGSPSLSHVAFANPDGSKVLVLTNAGAETTAEVRLGDMSARVPLPADSVATLTWS
jgi:glucosylceramidase